MSNTISLDLARWLLQEVHKLDTRNGRADHKIYVKTSPAHFGANAHKHWGRALLVGIQGKNLVVKPVGGREAPIDPEGCQLWHSKLSFEIVQIIARYEENQRKLREARTKNEVDLMPGPIQKSPALTLNMRNAEVVQPKPPKPEPEPTPVVVALAPPPVAEKATPAFVLPTTVPSSFSDQLALFKQLQVQLAEKAGTEGIEKLRQLYRDRTEAIKMVEQCENEIVSVIAQLDEFKVQIPDDLLPKPGPENDHDPVGITAAGSLIKKSSNWTPGKAAKHRENIIAFLKSRKNLPARGPDIMDYIKEPKHNASSILSPLVFDGLLERTGQGTDTRYKIKGIVGPLIEEEDE